MSSTSSAFYERSAQFSEVISLDHMSCEEADKRICSKIDLIWLTITQIPDSSIANTLCVELSGKRSITSLNLAGIEIDDWVLADLLEKNHSIVELTCLGSSEGVNRALHSNRQLRDHMLDACRHGDTRLLAQCLNEGAPSHSMDRDGNTAISIALQREAFVCIHDIRTHIGYLGDWIMDIPNQEGLSSRRCIVGSNSYMKAIQLFLTSCPAMPYLSCYAAVQDQALADLKEAFNARFTLEPAAFPPDEACCTASLGVGELEGGTDVSGKRQLFRDEIKTRIKGYLQSVNTLSQGQVASSVSKKERVVKAAGGGAAGAAQVAVGVAPFVGASLASAIGLGKDVVVSASEAKVQHSAVAKAKKKAYLFSQPSYAAEDEMIEGVASTIAALFQNYIPDCSEEGVVQLAGKLANSWRKSAKRYCKRGNLTDELLVIKSIRKNISNHNRSIKTHQLDCDWHVQSIVNKSGIAYKNRDSEVELKSPEKAKYRCIVFSNKDKARSYLKWLDKKKKTNDKLSGSSIEPGSGNIDGD